MEIEDDVQVLGLCAFGLANLPPLIIRAVQIGTGEGPVFRLGEHLLSVALARLPARAVAMLATDPRSVLEEPAAPTEEGARTIRTQIYEPLQHDVRRRLGCACSGMGCMRMLPSCDEPNDGWLEPLLGIVKDAPSNRGIDMEITGEPCAAGLPLGKDDQCPWFRDVPFEDVVDELQSALRARLDAAGSDRH
jgi:hypothetical protein